MRLNRTTLAGVAVTALLLTPSLAFAEALIQGNIISHDGDKLVVRSSNGADTTVMLTPTTKVQAVVGLVGARREDHTPAELINGLAVNVDTVQNGAELDAVTITFKPGDLKTAQTVQAGTAEAKQRIIAAQQENERKQKENEQRLSMIGQFDVKAKTSVYFDTGKTTINAQGKTDLKAIAEQLAQTPGGLIRVVGFTDSTGSAASNQKLSNQRASAVTAYLLSECAVPGNKFASPAALGATLAGDDTDASNKAQNRRVTVSILISKAAQAPTPAASEVERQPAPKAP
jgi:outer membrane protein OmpA-like peptidoglycan-associated protein